MCGVTFGALVTDLVPLPKTYFANRHNFFNRWFVKIGWGWTLSLVGTFVYLTAYTYCCGKMDLVKKHLARLGVATAWWYFWTSFFNFIENTTGFCSTEGFDNKRACVEANGHWHGFDVSGHAFILIYCSLIIAEEVRVMKFWSRIPEVIQTEDERVSERLSEENLEIVKKSYLDNIFYVRALVVALTFLILIWDMMLLSTILYFHNMPQKLTGGALAILGWFITYQLWYQSTGPSPGSPGKGILKFMKD